MAGSPRHEQRLLISVQIYVHQPSTLHHTSIRGQAWPGRAEDSVNRYEDESWRLIEVMSLCMGVVMERIVVACLSIVLLYGSRLIWIVI